MRMSEKCRNNNSDNPWTSRRTDGSKNKFVFCPSPFSSVFYKLTTQLSYRQTACNSACKGLALWRGQCHASLRAGVPPLRPQL